MRGGEMSEVKMLAGREGPNMVSLFLPVNLISNCTQKQGLKWKHKKHDSNTITS